MALLDEIADRLALLDLGLIVKGQMPATPDRAVALNEYAGGGAETGFGFPGLQDELPGLQVKVRGVRDDYAGPRDVIETIYRELPKVQGQLLSGTMYRMIKPQQVPFILERDSSERCVFAVNFLCEKEFQ